MNGNEALVGVLIDETNLSLDELAQACAIEPDWLLVRLDAGLLSCCSETPQRRFASRDLQRARRMLALERDFDANPELAALVIDLLDELHQLRAQLHERGG